MYVMEDLGNELKPDGLINSKLFTVIRTNQNVCVCACVRACMRACLHVVYVCLPACLHVRACVQALTQVRPFYVVRRNGITSVSLICVNACVETDTEQLF